MKRKAPVSRKQFVGHWAYYVTEFKGALKVEVSGDWNAALLTVGEAEKLLGEKAQADKTFARSVAEGIAYFGGPVVFHFYVTISGGKKRIDILDCAPACEVARSAKDRLRLVTTKP